MALDNLWDERYSSDEYIYGTEPNEFFKSALPNLKSGTILLPCEGEGRNAVFAAKCGWSVIAFDSSTEGKKKAMKLSEINSVNINYYVMDVQDFKANEEFDAIALIYCHFESGMRERVHAELIKALKQGGTLILESFNKLQIERNTGGPKNIDMLYSEDILRKDFGSLAIKLIEENSVELSEGSLHKGQAEIVRMLAVKI